MECSSALKTRSWVWRSPSSASSAAWATSRSPSRLWGGGVSFAGVIAFVCADLVTIPVLNVYRKYYGWRVMAYILGVFFVTMAFSGFLMEELFDALGIVLNLAGGQTATEQTYFEFNYTFYLTLIAFALSGFLLYVYRRGLGAPGQYRDPVCGTLSYYQQSRSRERCSASDPIVDTHP